MSAAPAEAGSRGELTIEPQVVEKLVAVAATEIDEVEGAARRVLSVALGSDAHAVRPQVEAHVDGRSVALVVRCSIRYPAPIAEVTETLRAHLVRRVDALTGLSTRQVDIVVAALTDPSAARTTSSQQRELQ